MRATTPGLNPPQPKMGKRRARSKNHAGTAEFRRKRGVHQNWRVGRTLICGCLQRDQRLAHLQFLEVLGCSDLWFTPMPRSAIRPSIEKVRVSFERACGAERHQRCILFRCAGLRLSNVKRLTVVLSLRLLSHSAREARFAREARCVGCASC